MEKGDDKKMQRKVLSKGKNKKLKKWQKKWNEAWGTRDYPLPIYSLTHLSVMCKFHTAKAGY